MKNKIVVEIEGGLVTNVWSIDPEVEVEVIDYDVIDYDDLDFNEEINDHPYLKDGEVNFPAHGFTNVH